MCTASVYHCTKSDFLLLYYIFFQIQVPFDTYFKVQPLLKYHRVVTMENFMKTIALDIWPPQKRIGMYYIIFKCIYQLF
jgi:hypothetical protein